MTSLNMPGFSISLLNVSRVNDALSSIDTDFNLPQLLDDPTSASSWLGVRSYWPSIPLDRVALEAETSQFLQSLSPANIAAPASSQEGTTPTLSFWRQADISPAAVNNAIVKACEKVMSVENDLTKFDTVVGDGDCGETFARGAAGKSFLFVYTNTRPICHTVLKLFWPR